MQFCFSILRIKNMIKKSKFTYKLKLILDFIIKQIIKMFIELVLEFHKCKNLIK